MGFVDLSSYTKVTDWDKLARSIDGRVILRSTVKAGTLDKSALTFYNEATKRNLVVEWYKFMYSTSAQGAYLEISNAIDMLMLNGIKPSMMWVDIEAIAGVNHTKAMIKEIIDGASRACINHGVPWGIYCNRSYYDKLVPHLMGVPYWLARYADNLGEVSTVINVRYWQKSATHKVSGIDGYCDWNEVL